MYKWPFTIIIIIDDFYTIPGDKTPNTSDFLRANSIKIEVTATPLYLCVQQNTTELCDLLSD